MSIMFEFKSLTEQDIKLLFTWSAQPELQLFWNEPTEWNLFYKKYMQKILSDTTLEAFVVYVKGKPIGYCQWWKAAVHGADWLPDCSLGVFGIDQYLGDLLCWGKGLGAQMIMQFCKKLFYDTALACTKIIVDPAVTNSRAISCYEKIGFVRVIAKVPESVCLMELSQETMK